MRHTIWGKISEQDGGSGGIWTSRGNVLSNLNARVICYWFCFTSHYSQALDPQGGIQGSGIGKVGVLLSRVDYRGYRDYYAPTLVTP